jgi:hypothetical protein
MAKQYLVEKQAQTTSFFRKKQRGLFVVDGFVTVVPGVTIQ